MLERSTGDQQEQAELIASGLVVPASNTRGGRLTTENSPQPTGCGLTSGSNGKWNRCSHHSRLMKVTPSHSSAICRQVWAFCFESPAKVSNSSPASNFQMAYHAWWPCPTADQSDSPKTPTGFVVPLATGRSQSWGGPWNGNLWTALFRLTAAGLETGEEDDDEPDLMSTWRPSWPAGGLPGRFGSNGAETSQTSVPVAG